MRTACQYQLPPSLARPPPCRHPGCRPRRATTTGRRPRQRPRRRAAAGNTRPWCLPTPSTPLHSQRDLRWVHILPLVTTLQVRRGKSSLNHIQFIFQLSSSQPNSVPGVQAAAHPNVSPQLPPRPPTRAPRFHFFFSIVTLNQSRGNLF